MVTACTGSSFTTARSLPHPANFNQAANISEVRRLSVSFSFFLYRRHHYSEESKRKGHDYSANPLRNNDGFERTGEDISTPATALRSQMVEEIASLSV